MGMEKIVFGMSIIVIVLLLCLIIRNYIKVLSSNEANGSTAEKKEK